jgi:hypothetical protein
MWVWLKKKMVVLRRLGRTKIVVLESDAARRRQLVEPLRAWRYRWRWSVQEVVDSATMWKTVGDADALVIGRDSFPSWDTSLLVDRVSPHLESAGVAVLVFSTIYRNLKIEPALSSALKSARSRSRRRWMEQHRGFALIVQVADSTALLKLEMRRTFRTTIVHDEPGSYQVRTWRDGWPRNLLALNLGLGLGRDRHPPLYRWWVFSRLRNVWWNGLLSFIAQHWPAEVSPDHEDNGNHIAPQEPEQHPELRRGPPMTTIQGRRMTRLAKSRIKPVAFRRLVEETKQLIASGDWDGAAAQRRLLEKHLVKVRLLTKAGQPIEDTAAKIALRAACLLFEEEQSADEARATVAWLRVEEFARTFAREDEESWPLHLEMDGWNGFHSIEVLEFMHPAGLTFFEAVALACHRNMKAKTPGRFRPVQDEENRYYYRLVAV